MEEIPPAPDLGPEPPCLHPQLHLGLEQEEVTEEITTTITLPAPSPPQHQYTTSHTISLRHIDTSETSDTTDTCYTTSNISILANNQFPGKFSSSELESLNHLSKSAKKILHFYISYIDHTNKPTISKTIPPPPSTTALFEEIKTLINQNHHHHLPPTDIHLSSDGIIALKDQNDMLNQTITILNNEKDILQTQLNNMHLVSSPPLVQLNNRDFPPLTSQPQPQLQPQPQPQLQPQPQPQLQPQPQPQPQPQLQPQPQPQPQLQPQPQPPRKTYALCTATQPQDDFLIINVSQDDLFQEDLDQKVHPPSLAVPQPLPPLPPTVPTPSLNPPPPPPPLLLQQNIPRPLGSPSIYLPIIDTNTPLHLQEYIVKIKNNFSSIKKHVKGKDFIKKIRILDSKTALKIVHRVVNHLSSATNFKQIEEICQKQLPIKNSMHYPPLPNFAPATKEWEFITQNTRNNHFINFDKIVILSQAYNLEFFQQFVRAKTIQPTHPHISKEFFSLLYIPVYDVIDKVSRTVEEMKMDLYILFITFRLTAYENYAGSELYNITPSLKNPTKQIFLKHSPFSPAWCSEMYSLRRDDPLAMDFTSFKNFFCNSNNNSDAFQSYFNHTTQYNTTIKLSYNNNAKPPMPPLPWLNNL